MDWQNVHKAQERCKCIKNFSLKTLKINDHLGVLGVHGWVITKWM